MRSGGAVYKKRTESTILNACLDYLKLLENQKLIFWCDRLNSGTVFIPATRFTKPRKIRLCRAGTADAYFITKDGVFVFIETKKDGKQEPEQKEFQAMIEGSGHKYWLINDVNILMIRVKEFLDDRGLTSSV